MLKISSYVLLGEVTFVPLLCYMLGTLDWATASVIITITVTIISSIFGLFIKILSNKHVESLRSSLKNNIHGIESSVKERFDKFEITVAEDFRRLELRINRIDTELDTRLELMNNKVVEHRLNTERHDVEIKTLKEQIGRLH